jgi:uncharacterized protein YbaP (TraB family)
MNRLISFAFVICFISCSPFTSKFPGKVDTQKNAYVNDSLKLSLNVLKDWVIVKDQSSEINIGPLLKGDWDSKMLIGMTNPKRRAFGRLLVSSKDYSQDEYLKVYADHLKNDSLVSIADAKWTINGDTAAILEYTIQRNNDIKDRYLEFIFMSSGHLLRLQFWTLSALFDDYKPIFYTIIRQIEVKKEQDSYSAPWNLPDSLLFGKSIDFIKVNYSPSTMTLYGNPCVDSNRSLCWKVKSLTNTVYVLGSIHLAKPELYPLKPSVENAFKSCKVLALELNSESPSLKKEISKYVKEARYPLGQKIKNHISDDCYSSLKKGMKSVGMSVTLFEIFHPWLLGTIITQMKYQKMGISPEYGLDSYFLKKANESSSKKEIVELEKVDDQMKLYQEYCDNELFLAYTLFGLDQLEKQIVPLLAAWKCGNTKIIERLTLTEDIAMHPEFEQLIDKLIYKRNEKIAEKISGYLQDNRDYFVVFGCGHTVGTKSVIAILSKKGYRIEQL